MQLRKVDGHIAEDYTILHETDTQRTCPVTKKARNATFDLPASFACRARARMPNRIELIRQTLFEDDQLI